MKILHLPTDVGMRAYSLCRAERELGCDSRMVVRSLGVHDSGSGKTLRMSNSILTAGRLLVEVAKGLSADVIMANAGRSLVDFAGLGINLVDIPLYSLFKKKIIVTYQGCDIRLCETCPVRSYLPREIQCPNIRGFSYGESDEIKLKRFAIWSRYADSILGITPDLCLVDGVSFTPHAKYIDLNKHALPVKTRESTLKFRIGHMSRRHVRGRRMKGVEFLKGTPYVENVLLTLMKEFPSQVEYVPIENLSWAECLNAIASCDLLIDQVISGWYGGVSVEAGLLGTLPVAYIDKKLYRYVPEVMTNNLPVFPLGDKGELYDVLVYFLKNKDKLSQEAASCQINSIMFHDAREISKKHLTGLYVTA